jgi:hypothetical protein
MEKQAAPVVESEAKHDASATVAPVIVDLGSAKKSQIKQLAKGQGKLTERVLGIIDELKSDGTLNGSAQPVIVIVKKKISRKNLISRLL